MKILITGGNGNIAKMIKSNLSSQYDIKNPSRQELNVLNLNEIQKFLTINHFDILIHTAILGGRRTKEETGEVTHKNILMFENMLKFSTHFKIILNFDSGAIYDRTTDILNRKEDELFTVPIDNYGFSKYVIYNRTLQYNNIFNLRIFNIFHKNEEPDRFIKSCINAKTNNTIITIFQDKYFDFVYETDFIKIIEYYISNVNSTEQLEKTINICYEKKYKLSEIAQLILPIEQINILDSNMIYNYSGNSCKLYKYNIPFIGLESSIKLCLI